MLKKIKYRIMVPSAAYTLKLKQLKFYKWIDKAPEVGDVVFGEVQSIGEHSSMENKSGRIHMIHNKTRGIFVFGNRYAPDYFEGVIPDKMIEDVDLLARSGVIGIVKEKNSLKKDPTKIKIWGYLVDENENIVNTRDYNLVIPTRVEKKFPRAKMILVVGTSMNSGKSMAATAACWVLSTLGKNVRASKVTGTASLKDILSMNDAGAEYYSDFTHLGYPSTYLLSKEDLLGIFNRLDLKYANNPSNYWVVEIADGILQRETAMLLESSDVRSRIHKLIFASYDAFGAIGGLKTLKDKFDLEPDLISGVCSSSPLHIRELSEFSQKPVFNSIAPDPNKLFEALK